MARKRRAPTATYQATDVSLPKSMFPRWYSMRPFQLTKTIYLLPAWGIALFAALSLADVRSSWSDLLCGPWGCSAPLEAIVSCHLAWLIVLGPPFAWLQRTLSRRSRFVMASAVSLSAMVGAIVIATRPHSESVASSTRALPVSWQIRQSAIDVIGFVDAPVIPLLLLGLGSLTWQLFSRRHRVSPEAIAVVA